MPQKLNTYQKFIERIDCEGGLNACWPWLSSKYTTGYGRFKYKHKEYLAHRFAYAFFWDKQLETIQVVMHTCDNPSCCNPLHLKAGTQLENMKDKMAKGRFSNGIRKNKNNKPHNSLQIKQLHLEGHTNQEIAKIIKCHRHTVRNYLCKIK
jgi:hypothetical protein